MKRFMEIVKRFGLILLPSQNKRLFQIRLDENLPSALRWLDAKSGVPWVVLTARGFFQPLQLLHSDSGSLPQLHRESSSNRSESSNDMRSPSSIHSNMIPNHSGVCRCQPLLPESSSDGEKLHHDTIHEVLHHKGSM